jgi:hypothetical protein
VLAIGIDFDFCIVYGTGWGAAIRDDSEGKIEG